MEPFFFGPDNALFGAYHPPTFASRDLESAVVVCQGIGHEYMRCHRACWSLAEALAARNAHVLRFDYRNTGDSLGAPEAADWSQWQADVATALLWLQTHSGLQRVRLVGVRAGALLAAPAAVDRPEIESVTLWDPVFSGADYLADLSEQHRIVTEQRNRYRPLRHAYDAKTDDGVLGFVMPRTVQEPLARANLADATSRPAPTSWRLAAWQAVERYPALADRLPEDLLLELDNDPGWDDPGQQFRRVSVARSLRDLVDLVLR